MWLTACDDEVGPTVASGKIIIRRIRNLFCRKQNAKLCRISYNPTLPIVERKPDNNPIKRSVIVFKVARDVQPSVEMEGKTSFNISTSYGWSYDASSLQKLISEPNGWTERTQGGAKYGVLVLLEPIGSIGWPLSITVGPILPAEGIYRKKEVPSN